MLNRQIIVNASPYENRIALIERERVAELYIERPHQESMLHRIIKGKVTRVLPGMQSAFVDIGGEKSGFLYVSDVFNDDLLKAVRTYPDSEIDEIESDSKSFIHNLHRPPIEQMLTEGQEIFVQVVKDPIGTKGARLSMFLTIPGRFLVLMPNFKHIGISKKITNQDEKIRLKNIIESNKPDNLAFIVRTAADAASETQLVEDLKYLSAVWEQIKHQSTKHKAPHVVFKDLDLTLRIVRDHLSNDIDQIIVDHQPTAQSIRDFLSLTSPELAQRVREHTQPSPIFDIYGVEMDLAQALEKRIELASGGSIVVEQTEAMTTIDVNTGRFVGKKNARDTVLRTNQEAVIRIAEQIRLRNIGGIIVIDFIDMEQGSDREAIYNQLQSELKKDRAKTSVIRMSELGLVQLTRKRTIDSLEHVLLDDCPHCNGRGKVKNTITVAHDLIREIIRTHCNLGKNFFTVSAPEDIRDWIMEEEFDWIQDLIDQFGITINFSNPSQFRQMPGAAAYEIIAET
jgi:ribonuclease G